MNGLECATWFLVAATIILAGGALYHALITKRSSRDEVNALNELTKAILKLPNIEEAIKRQKELQNIRDEEKAKRQNKALTGY